MTALAAAHGGARPGDPAALTNGFSAAFLGAAGIAVAGALLTLRQPPRAGGRSRLAESSEAPVGEPAVAE